MYFGTIYSIIRTIFKRLMVLYYYVVCVLRGTVDFIRQNHDCDFVALKPTYNNILYNVHSIILVVGVTFHCLYNRTDVPQHREIIFLPFSLLYIYILSLSLSVRIFFFTYSSLTILDWIKEKKIVTKKKIKRNM